MSIRKNALLVLALLLLLSGCSAAQPETQEVTQILTEASDAPTQAPTQRAALTEAPTQAERPTQPPTEPPTEAPTQPPTEARRAPVVCIDPGHQRYGNSEREPNGPGSSELKAKVTGGATGAATGQSEYALNLEVGLKLQELLEEEGCVVVMTRTDNDVDISNAERAQMANESGADVFLRIHANGADSSSARGAMTICMSDHNPYNKQLYVRSRALSEAVLTGVVNATGCRRESVWETDTMTGINWSEVPVTIIEMGYLSNPEEDRLMAMDEYQWKLAQGMAEGILDYLSQYPPETEEGADYGG